MIAMVMAVPAIVIVIVLVLISVAVILYYKDRWIIQLKKKDLELIDDIEDLSDSVDRKRKKKGGNLLDQVKKSVDKMEEGDKTVEEIRKRV